MLDIKADVNDITVLDDVVAAFEAESAAVPGLGEGAGLDQVVQGNHLGTDEAAGHVAVHSPCRVEGGAAFAQ